MTSRLSRPAVERERTRISCLVALDKAAPLPFSYGRRMMFDNATHPYRKSGVAELRNLWFRVLFVEIYFDGAKPTCPGVPWSDCSFATTH